MQWDIVQYLAEDSGLYLTLRYECVYLCFSLTQDEIIEKAQGKVTELEKLAVDRGESQELSFESSYLDAHQILLPEEISPNCGDIVVYLITDCSFLTIDTESYIVTLATPERSTETCIGAVNYLRFSLDEDQYGFPSFYWDVNIITEVKDCIAEEISFSQSVAVLDYQIGE